MIKNFFLNFFKKRWVATISFVFLLGYFIFSLVVLYTPLPNFLARFFYVEPKIKKSDAILILSASSYPDGTLTLFTLGREIEGIILYKEGWGSKMIFVGNSQKTVSDVIKMKELAVRLGVPEDDILIGPNSTNTYFNLKEAKEIMEKNNLKNALLVTSSFHSRRCLLIAKKLNLEISPASYSIDQYRQVSADRFVLFWSEIREVLALIYYKIKGWI